MTSAVGKMFNSILNPRLDDLLCNNNIINNCQIGFTKMQQHHIICSL